MPWEELYRLLWKYKLLRKWKVGAPSCPDSRFTELFIRVCSLGEKDEFLRELIPAAISCIKSGNTEALCGALLAWEYTCLWKDSPEELRKLNTASEKRIELNHG